MLNQTTTNIGYSVDVPISADGVLRHREFVLRAADRRVYGRRTYPWQIQELQDRQDEQVTRRTEINLDTTRNVRQRLVLEGPIRPPLRCQDHDYYYNQEGSGSEDESDSNERQTVDLTGEEDTRSINGTLVVEALDPGISIATAIDPIFQGNRLPQSYRNYFRMLETRLLAIERRGDSYLTGELSDQQMRSVNDSLQSKLSRLFHPMLDKLEKDLQDFAEQSMQRIEKRFTTLEKDSEHQMLDQCRSMVTTYHQTNDSQLQEYHQARFKELTSEMHSCFLRSEELSTTKMFTIQQEIVKQLLKLETRLDEVEGHAVKDRTLTSSVQNRLQLIEEEQALTNLQTIGQQEDALSQILRSTAEIQLTLEATINDKFNSLEQSIMDSTIQRMVTYMDYKLNPMLTSNEESLSAFRDGSLKLL